MIGHDAEAARGVSLGGYRLVRPLGEPEVLDLPPTDSGESPASGPAAASPNTKPNIKPGTKPATTPDAPRAAVVQRWLALEPRSLADAAIYVFDCPAGGGAARGRRARLAAALARLSKIDHPHVLACSRPNALPDGLVWASAAYTGSHDGLVTLARLLDVKGGRLPVFEAARAVEQVLEAAVAAQHAGAAHGPIAATDLVVDRRGSVSLELCGVRRALADAAGLASTGELVRDEARSVCQLAYRLLTGIEADEPLVPAERLVKRLPAAWSAWLGRGLDAAGGYDSAEQALAALPARSADPEDQPAVFVRANPVLRQLRRVVPTGRRWRGDA